MSGLPTQALGSVTNPDMRALLTQLKQEIFLTFNCHQLGTIQTFNAVTQTATVTLNFLRSVPDLNQQPAVYRTVQYPVLADVPVFVPRGGTGRLTFPIQPGDTCLVLFNDRDFDTWFATGNVAAPNSTRAHDLSDGLALVGFSSLANALPNYDTANAVLQFAGGKIKVANKLDLAGQLTTMTNVMGKLYDALNALNGKTGPSAAAQITAFQTEYLNLLQ